MTTRSYVLAGVGLFLVGAAVGRFSLPAKTVEKTVTVTEKATEKDDHSTKVVVSVKKPDGTVVTTTKIQNDVTRLSDTRSMSEKDKTVEYDTRRTSVSAILAARPFSQVGVAYGVGIQYRFLGPLVGGIQGLSDGTVGVSLGLSF